MFHTQSSVVNFNNVFTILGQFNIAATESVRLLIFLSDDHFYLWSLHVRGLGLLQEGEGGVGVPVHVVSVLGVQSKVGIVKVNFEI